MRLRCLGVAIAAGSLLASSSAPAQVSYNSSDPGILSDAALTGPYSRGRGTRGFGWIEIATPAFARSRCGGGVIGTKDFWVFGGETSTGLRIGTVETWNRQTNTWSQSATVMRRPVSNIMGSVAFVNGLFYVFGGLESGDVPISEIQVYNPTTDTWSVHPTRLPAPRYGVGAAEIGGGRVLVCGGADLLFFYGQSYIFDTVTGSLTAGPPMAAPDFNISITREPNQFDGKVYLTGLATDTYMQVYDVATNTFAIGPVFANNRSRAGCGLVNLGKLVLAYAGDWLNYRDDTEMYDVVSMGASQLVPNFFMVRSRRTFAYGDTPCPGLLGAGGFNGAYMQHAEGAR